MLFKLFQYLELIDNINKKIILVCNINNINYHNF